MPLAMNSTIKLFNRKKYLPSGDIELVCVDKEVVVDTDADVAKVVVIVVVVITLAVDVELDSLFVPLFVDEDPPVSLLVVGAIVEILEFVSCVVVVAAVYIVDGVTVAPVIDCLVIYQNSFACSNKF